MKILLLEDDLNKKKSVEETLFSVDQEINVEYVDNFVDFLKLVERNVYDLIIADLVVLRSPQEREPVDMTSQIIDATRDHSNHNFRTPVIALTRFDSKAEDSFKDLNSKDITVITFDESNEKWKESLAYKVSSCTPAPEYDVVIVCALKKEADAFASAGFSVGETKVVSGLLCRRLQIRTYNCVIVTAPRMGLVSCAVTTTRAIELFKPKLVCMSGICGGVEGKSKIYDVVIPETCHQNDAGKWENGVLKPEVYSVPLDHAFGLKLDHLVSHKSFSDLIAQGVKVQKSELPEKSEELDFDVFLAPASSGSAVLADAEIVQSISGQQRKLSAFEMESFALYEAARLSPSKPLYFSAKAVVDDGSSTKGDVYHRVACVLSAKVVYECIAAGLFVN
jgi:nucleoside phosphorylase